MEIICHFEQQGNPAKTYLNIHNCNLNLFKHKLNKKLHSVTFVKYDEVCSSRLEQVKQINRNQINANPIESDCISRYS